MGTKLQTVKIPLLKSCWGREIENKVYDCTFVGEHFAVLKKITWSGQDKRLWQVTHRPTGRCAGTNFLTKKSAVEYAKWLERRGARLGIDWKCRGYKRLEKMEGWPALRENVRKWRIQNGSSPV